MSYAADISGRGDSTTVLVRRGAVALAGLAAVIVLLLMQYQGVFRSSFPARVLLPDIGDGVSVGADVKLRGVLVGEVSAVRLRTTPGQLPLNELDLALDPGKAAGIPAGVTARVVPTNVFGAPSIEFLDPPGTRTTMLARDAVIQADTSQETLQLQSVINQVYRILSAVKPADVNVALTNIAQSLQGRGSQLGALITNADQYIGALNVHTPTFNALLGQIGPTLRSLSDTAPTLFDAADNLVASAQTLLDKRDQLVRVLADAPGVAGNTDTFLHQIENPALSLLSHLHGVGDVLAGQYRNIPASLAALHQAIPLLQDGLNGGLDIQVSLAPFPTYTNADCPRYLNLSGANCPRGGETR